MNIIEKIKSYIVYLNKPLTLRCRVNSQKKYTPFLCFSKPQQKNMFYGKTKEPPNLNWEEAPPFCFMAEKINIYYQPIIPWGKNIQK